MPIARLKTIKPTTLPIRGHKTQLAPTDRSEKPMYGFGLNPHTRLMILELQENFVMKKLTISHINIWTVVRLS